MPTDRPPYGREESSSQVLEVDRHRVERVVTFDGRYWIDPYTLHLQQVDKDFDQHTTSQMVAAQQAGRRPYPIFELLTLRWEFHLRKAWERDTRFCLFDAAGHWLNPATGRWHSGVATATGTSLSRRALRSMAEALAKVPDSHPDALLPLPELMRLRNAQIDQQRTPLAVTDEDFDSEYAPLADPSRTNDISAMRRLGIASLTEPFPGAALAIDNACPNGISGHLHRPLIDGSRLLLLAQCGSPASAGASRTELASALAQVVDGYQTGDHHLHLPALLLRLRQLLLARLIGLSNQAVQLLAVVWLPHERLAYVCPDGFPMPCVISAHRSDHLRSLADQAPAASTGRLGPALRCYRCRLDPNDRLICFNNGLLLDLPADTIWQVYADFLSRLPGTGTQILDGLITDLNQEHVYALPANLLVLALDG